MHLLGETGITDWSIHARIEGTKCSLQAQTTTLHIAVPVTPMLFYPLAVLCKPWFLYIMPYVFNQITEKLD